MIDAEMYGMMPSAKIVRFWKLPPVKRFTRPTSEFWLWAKNSRSAARLIPGIGMKAPIR